MNLIQVAKKMMSEKGRDELLNQALSSIPPNERQFLMQYKGNAMQGIVDGAKQGKISMETFSKLKSYVKKLRLLGIKIPTDKLDEVEQVIKDNSNNNRSNNFSIF